MIALILSISSSCGTTAARAAKLAAEAAVVPQELEIDKINAITRNLREGNQEDKEFERRMRVADTLLKNKAIEGKTDVNNTKRDAVPAGPSQRPLQRDVPTPPSPRGPAEPTGNQGGGVI